ncbi:hypothetical protein GP486_006543 [Trichoglossum hirsutum]|uniref:Zinc finger C2H2 LYAR-type domain-containing protein n=1 Tax=Trichoglossum hirsutum TaxID=265104 RepID=A0A9P8L5I1_9PEZI|nr:hypothetical protein GP486_006543 [Trichoglossum hirsutum]
MEYRAHTSCVSEAQKYQGGLYKENGKSKNSKASKAQKKGNNSKALVPRQPYVEDAPDPDAGALAIVDAPPHAPSPPPAAHAVLAQKPERPALPPVNVFDFLVTDDTPNASRVSLPAPPPSPPPPPPVLQRQQSQQPQQQQQQPQPQQQQQEQVREREQEREHEVGMKMVENAPAIFDPNRRPTSTAMSGEDGAMILQEYEDQMYESDRRESGYQTGDGDNVSISSAPAQSQERALVKKQEQQIRQRPQQQAFLTPAPKRERELSKHRDGSRGREHKSKDGKKRKRYHGEDFDLSVVRTSYKSDRDAVMTDAPVLHSGLTNGMERMFSSRSGAEYPSPSPDYPDDVPVVAQTPASPLKRTRHSQTETRGRQKGVKRGLLSLVSSGTSTVSTRKSSSTTQNTTTSDDRPPRKHHRHHRRRDDSERSHQRKLKAIEYHPTVEQPENSQNQLIIYQSRAELFTSFISKGPESTIGCSMNKALKRYHRERADRGIGMGRVEEEKELWKSLRLKRNERGEIVLFF